MHPATSTTICRPTRSTNMEHSVQHRMTNVVTVSVAGTCFAILCLQGALGQQGAHGEAYSDCVTDAQLMKEGNAAADPGQFSTAGCDAAGAEKYAICDVRGSAGSCAGVPACLANLTINIGCTASNADTGCCQQYVRKECPECKPTVDWCMDTCGDFKLFKPFSNYPPEVVDNYCTDITNVFLTMLDRDNPGDLPALGCDVATAHTHAFCGMEGSAGSCSNKPECEGVRVVSTSSCLASNSEPTCCSVSLAKECSLCEPTPARCEQVCNLIFPAPSLTHENSDGAGPGPAVNGASPLAASSSRSKDEEVRLFRWRDVRFCCCCYFLPT